jgi:uncharacterized protein with PIN domain
MKREIACPECADRWREVGRVPAVAAAGEKVVVVEGAALRAYECDGCGLDLWVGDTCATVTLLMPDESTGLAWAREYVAPHPEVRHAV